MMKSLNTRIFWCWTLYCIVGCSLLPEVVMGARYLPTRRSIPTQLERNERLRELFQHILESERDAHLSAANQFADQLKLIQKKSSDFGMLPDSLKDYNDEFGDEYDEKADHLQYNGRKVHLQPQKQQQHQRQPRRYALSYGHGGVRNNPKIDSTNNAISVTGLDDLVSNAPRSQQPQQFIQKMYRGKQEKSVASSANGDVNGEPANDLDWMTSTSELNSATDYDALFDDVNERRSQPPSSSLSSSLPLSSSSNLKYDHYRRTSPLAQQRKLHLN